MIEIGVSFSCFPFISFHLFVGSFHGTSGELTLENHNIYEVQRVDFQGYGELIDKVKYCMEYERR
jgi:hypothetical protein